MIMSAVGQPCKAVSQYLPSQVERRSACLSHGGQMSLVEQVYDPASQGEY